MIKNMLESWDVEEDRGRWRLQHHHSLLLILDFLNAIDHISDCRGQFGFHKLKGKRKGEYSMKVSGNYRITFKWDGRDVYDMDYEDYH